jgi:hypothetical protein
MAAEPNNEGPRSVRQHLQAAIEDARAKEAAALEFEKQRQAKAGTTASIPQDDKARDDKGRFAPKDPPEEVHVEPQVKPKGEPVEARVDKAPPQEDTTPAKEEPAASQETKLAPPISWAKDQHSAWEKAPPEVQKYILKREQDMKAGVDQLKNQYQEFESAVFPYRDTLKAIGQTPGATFRNMMEWQKALKGPDKARAFQQLAREFGVDLTPFAPQQQQQDSQAQPGQTPADLQGYLQSVMRQELAPVFQTLQQREQETRTRAAEAELRAWAKDKPHFDRVRGSMLALVDGDMAFLNAGQPPRWGIADPTGKVDLDKAYDYAVRLDTDLMAEIEAKKREEIARDAEAKALAAAKKAAEEAERKRKEVEAAKAAGTSLKSGTSAGVSPPRNSPLPKGESVRESLKRTLKELRS